MGVWPARCRNSSLYTGSGSRASVQYRFLSVIDAFYIFFLELARATAVVANSPASLSSLSQQYYDVRCSHTFALTAPNTQRRILKGNQLLWHKRRQRECREYRCTPHRHSPPTPRTRIPSKFFAQFVGSRPCSYKGYASKYVILGRKISTCPSQNFIFFYFFSDPLSAPNLKLHQ